MVRGFPGARIAFVGESAGGGLTVATLVALKEAGLPQPSSAAVFSPWAGLTVSGASATSKADLDPELTPLGPVLSPDHSLGVRPSFGGFGW
ncbi:alpha/beta hydrolase fold domain-containing protein [Streptomyces sp. NPDC002758]